MYLRFFKGPLTKPHRKFRLYAGSYMPSSKRSTSRILLDWFINSRDRNISVREPMISGGELHRQHRNSLRLLRLGSTSEAPSLRTLIPELKDRVMHTSRAPSFFFFFFIAFLLCGALTLTVLCASCCVCLLSGHARFCTLCMRAPD